MPESIYRGFADGGVLRVSLITGHATASTLTGITTADQLIFIGHFSTAADVATLVDYTSGGTISAANTITWAATTADDHMWVWWWDVTPANTGTATPPLDLGYSSGARICMGLADGGAANAELTLTGITTACKLLHVLHLTTKASIATLADLTATASIPAAGKVANTTATDNDQLLVVWLDPSPAATVNSLNGNERFTIKLGDGAAANTNIAISGIETADEIISELEWATKASVATCTDRTSEASITSDGNIQNDTTSTANDLIMCAFYDKGY